ncbi:unnamed protein product, partial [Phaeothamnion confervicola]
VALAGPRGSPYEGAVIPLEIWLSECYPFEAPAAVLLRRRLFHLNFATLPGGATAALPELFRRRWDASWDLRRLIGAVLALLAEPDPLLLPE